MKKVTRTIETHKINPAKVRFIDGKVETTPLDPINVSNQSITEEKALKLVQKKYGKANQYIIISIESTETTYGVDFDEFMKIAKVIEK